ncbi:MAG TPA: sigma-70 family RNA polymerase sigma factor [Longimicrobiales bacterium]
MDRTQSFEAEALPHLDAVYRFALRLAGSPADAEDLVQETFLRAYRAWEQYTPGTRAKSWLFTICRNVFLRQRERSVRHDEILHQAAGSADAAGADSPEGPLFAGASADDPEGNFFRELVDDSVLDAIEALPDEFRDAVILSDLEGLAYAEIAAVLDIPVGTVKSRLFRGRRQLQEKLYAYAVDNGYIRPRANHG